MNEVEKRKEAISEELGLFADAEELFEYIISKNKGATPLEDKYRTEENLVKGCVSSLWLVREFDAESGHCRFKSDADSIITKGIAALVCGMYDNLSPEDVLQFEPEFLEKFGISAHLSPNRRNGLSQIYRLIREFAEDEKNNADKMKTEKNA